MNLYSRAMEIHDIPELGRVRVSIDLIEFFQAGKTLRTLDHAERVDGTALDEADQARVARYLRSQGLLDQG